MPRTNRGRRPSPTKHPGHASQNASAEKQQEVKDSIFQSVQEMFGGRIEPEVVYMVLQEFDWNEEKAIDSLFSLCGESIDTDAKQNKLAEIAAQVLGILEAPEVKFDKGEFPPLHKGFEFPYMDSSLNKTNESATPDYESNKSFSTMTTESRTSIEKTSRPQESLSQSDNLRSALDNLKKKHMGSSNTGDQTSMFGSWLSAAGSSESQQVTSSPQTLMSVASVAQTVNKSRHREHSLSPDSSVHEQMINGRSRNMMYQHRMVSPVQTVEATPYNKMVSPVQVESENDIDIDLKQALSHGQALSVIGGEIEAKKRQKSKERTSIMASPVNVQVPKKGKAKVKTPVVQKNNSQQNKGFNPLSESILSGTFQLTSQAQTMPSTVSSVDVDGSVSQTNDDINETHTEVNTATSSVWPVMSKQKLKSEIDDDIAEESFPDQKSQPPLKEEHNMGTKSVELDFSSYNNWPDNQGSNLGVFPSAYELKSESVSIFKDLGGNQLHSGRSVTKLTTSMMADSSQKDKFNSLESEDSVDLNINELLSENCVISEDGTEGLSAVDKSKIEAATCSPNVWSPSRSTDMDESKNLTAGLKKLLNIGEESAENNGNSNIKAESKVERSNEDMDIKTGTPDLKSNTYAKSAYSLEEIRADAAFSLSVDAPVFVPRFPAKEAMEIPKPLSAPPMQESKPQFMTPKCPVRSPQQPQSFMPKVIVQNMPQYRMPSFPLPPPIIPHPLGTMTIGKSSQPGMPVAVNPLLGYPARGTVPYNIPLSYSSATKKQVQPKVSQKVTSSSKNSNADQNVQLDQYALSIKKSLEDDMKYLIIMRGISGSGKTTLARQLKGDGEMFSTDDYFMVGGEYLYDKKLLPEAHEWNKSRVKKAMLDGVSPVIVDNTNTQSWEIKPYVKFAYMYDYEVKFVEPDTKWKYNAKECVNLSQIYEEYHNATFILHHSYWRSTHKVPLSVMKSMLDRYEKNVTVESVLKVTKKKDNVNINSIDSVEVLPKDRDDESPSPLQSGVMNNIVDWSEEKEEDFFMKDTHVCEESIDKLNAETFGSSDGDYDDEQEPSWMDNVDISATEPAVVQSIKENSDAPIVLPSEKSAPKPLQPILHCTNTIDNLSKRRFLVSPSFTPSGLNVKKSGKSVKSYKNGADIVKTNVLPETDNSCVSSDVEEMVDDLIREHVQESVNSEIDFRKILEELKACLHLMPIESEQRPAVEQLIELKLKTETGYISSSQSNKENVETDSNLSIDKGKNLSDTDSTVGSLTPDARMSIDDEPVVAKFGDDYFSSSDDVNDKEIDFITSNLQKKQFSSKKSKSKHGNQTLKKNPSPFESIDDSEIKLSSVIDHIERRLSVLGISPSPTSVPACESVVHDFKNSSNVHSNEDERNQVGKSESDIEKNPNLCAETDKNADLKPKSSDRNVSSTENEMLSVEMKYWNLQKVEHSSDFEFEKDKKSEPEDNIPEEKADKFIENEKSLVNNYVTENQNLDAKSSNLGKDENLSHWAAEGETNYWNTNKNSVEFYNVASAENTWGSDIAPCLTLPFDSLSENLLTPLSDAEAKYWGILTNSSEKTSKSSVWEEESKKPEIPKPRRNKHSSDEGTRKGNKSNSEVDNVSEISKNNKNSANRNKNNTSIDQKEMLEFSDKVKYDTSVEKPESCFKNDSHENSPSESVSSGTSPDDCENSNKSVDLNNVGSGNNTPSPKRKKKSSKRKLAANFNVPFLDESFKESIKQDWNFPSLQTSENKTQQLEESSVDFPGKVMFDHSTDVSDDDLRILNIVNSSDRGTREYSDLPFRVIFARDVLYSREDSVTSDSVSSISDETNSNILPNKAVSVLMVDKSTSMEEVADCGIEFLHNCFPSVTEEELSHVLEQCNNNVQWAVDLMLEWKYHLYLTPEDKSKFVDAMLKVHNVPKEAMLDTASSLERKSPKSLFDMCMDYIEISGLSSREHLEKQIIQTGYLRLNSIEDKIRFRMNSVGAEQEICIDDDEFNDLVMKELLQEGSLDNACDTQNDVMQKTQDREDNGFNFSSNAERKQEQTAIFAKVNTEQTILQNGFDDQLHNHTSNVNFFEPVRKTPSEPVSDLHSLEVGTPPPLTSISQMTNSSPDLVSRSPDGLILTLNIPKEFAQALLSLFGPVGSYSPGSVDNIEVPVDYRTARALHNCWKQNYHPILVQNERQLKKDEAYAMKLQLEEDYAELIRQEENSVQTTHSLPSSRPPPIVSNATYAGAYGKIVRPQAVSLKDIMDEEKAREVQKQQHLQALHASGTRTALATKLKQQKLFEAFPGIDELILDDIYEANSCNLEDTIKAVKGSLASNTDRPQTVMTAEAAEAYEKKLIDAAEQQSLQEMMDSYLYRPKISKAVQLGDKPVNFADYRGEANIHYRLRHECFQKAQEAYSRGMKSVAVFYAEQGHQHTHKIKESNMKAADAILEQRNQQLQENSTLDLHGLHVDEAILALERILPQREIELQTFPDKKKDYLIIITGRGSHSRGGIAKLRPAVIAFLNRNKYRFSELYVGVLKVSLKYVYKS